MSYNINALRFCADIGMWALDASRETCVWKTDFCLQHCYNNKVYRMYHRAAERDRQNDTYWNLTPGKDIARDIQKAMDHHKGSNDRFRFATRGEFLGSISDVYKVAMIADILPHVHFWLPTRAWRSIHGGNPLFNPGRALYDLLLRVRRVMPNIHMIASLDPTTTPREFRALCLDGWSTMEFGTDFDPKTHTRCPKTEGEKGACSTCGLCFGKQQTHVHLRTH